MDHKSQQIMKEGAKRVNKLFAEYYANNFNMDLSPEELRKYVVWYNKYIDTVAEFHARLALHKIIQENS